MAVVIFVVMFITMFVLGSAYYLFKAIFVGNDAKPAVQCVVSNAEEYQKILELEQERKNKYGGRRFVFFTILAIVILYAAYA